MGTGCSHLGYKIPVVTAMAFTQIDLMASFVNLFFPELGEFFCHRLFFAFFSLGTIVLTPHVITMRQT